MSGKTGKRETGRKPLTTTRRSAKTPGAFGKEPPERTQTELERNINKAVAKKLLHAKE